MRGIPSVRTCARSPSSRADLPMPASPLRKTTCPTPALLCSQRRRSSPLSSSRPTSAGTMAVTNSSSWLGAASRPQTRLTASGSATPWSAWVPRSSRAKVLCTRRAVTALITTALAGARAWSRAAMLGVSPSARCSCRPPPPSTPPTTGPGVKAEPHGELHTVLCRQAGIQGGNGLDNAQAGVHGTPGIVFMGRGVAKIDQQAIAKVLGDMARIVLVDLGRGFLVGADHRTQVLKVELTGKLRGAHQVAEQHGELPPFRLRGRADRRCRQRRYRIRWCTHYLARRARWGGIPAGCFGKG